MRYFILDDRETSGFREVLKIEDRSKAYAIDYECDSRVYGRYFFFGDKQPNGNRAVIRLEKLVTINVEFEPIEHG